MRYSTTVYRYGKMPTTMQELNKMVVQRDEEARMFWNNVINKLDLRSGLILPIEFQNSDTGEHVGSLHASFVYQNHKTHIQLENFDSPAFAQIFFNSLEKDGEWEIHPGGIYRLNLNSLLRFVI